MNTIKYVAFLRGINVGGHKSIKMEELKNLFESLGFKQVKTVLNSGNVLFNSEQPNAANLAKTIEETLEKTYGYYISILIRTINELQSVVDAAPFRGIDITNQTRLYVTFLSEKSLNKIKTPYENPEKNFKIITISTSEVCSVLTLSPHWGTTESMKILEKEFGKKITTRNWNTVNKILHMK